MRNSMNPYGGVNPLIDKMIGNAYDIVKYVAKYLKEIRYVAENMELVYNSAHGYRIKLSGVADGIATSLVIAMPEDLTDYTTIESVNVVALYDDTTLTFPGPDTFEFTISGGNVNIQFHSDLPQVNAANYQVTIVHS